MEPSLAKRSWGKAASLVRAEGSLDEPDSRFVSRFAHRSRSLPVISEYKLHHDSDPPGRSAMIPGRNTDPQTESPKIVVSPEDATSPSDHGSRRRSILMEMNTQSKYFIDDHEAEVLNSLARQNSGEHFGHDMSSDSEGHYKCKEEERDNGYRSLTRKEGSRVLSEMRKFIVEYETLINVLIIAPFVLMSCYIVFVEDGDLVKGWTW